MGRQKRKLTAAEKRAKRQRQQEYETIFVNGKQKRVKRRPTIDGMDADEFILRTRTRSGCTKTACGST